MDNALILKGKKLGPLPSRCIVNFFLQKHVQDDWKMYKKNKFLVFEPPILDLSRFATTSKRLNYSIRSIFEQFKLEIVYPDVDSVLTKEDKIGRDKRGFQFNTVLEAFPANGRIAFISKNMIICFQFKHFQQLKAIGLIKKKIHKLIIGQTLNSSQLDEIKSSFTEVEHVLLDTQVDRSFFYDFILTIAPALHSKIEVLVNAETDTMFIESLSHLPIDCINETNIRFTGDLPKNPDFKLHPEVEECKISFYRHMSLKHLERVLAKRIAFLQLHAPYLRCDTSLLPDSTKVYWNRDKFFINTEYPYYSLTTFLPLFHKILTSSSNSPILVQLISLNFVYFEDGEMPPIRVYLFTSKNGALLEMGLQGDEPLITKKIPFGEFIEHSSNMKPLFDNFLQQMHNKYGIPI